MPELSSKEQRKRGSFSFLSKKERLRMQITSLVERREKLTQMINTKENELRLASEESPKKIKVS